VKFASTGPLLRSLHTWPAPGQALSAQFSITRAAFSSRPSTVPQAQRWTRCARGVRSCRPQVEQVWDGFTVRVGSQASPASCALARSIWRNSAGDVAHLTVWALFRASPSVVTCFTARISVAMSASRITRRRWSCARSRGGDWRSSRTGQRRADEPWPGCASPVACESALAGARAARCETGAGHPGQRGSGTAGSSPHGARRISTSSWSSVCAHPA